MKVLYSLAFKCVSDEAAGRVSAQHSSQLKGPNRKAD